MRQIHFLNKKNVYSIILAFYTTNTSLVHYFIFTLFRLFKFFFESLVALSYIHLLFTNLTTFKALEKSSHGVDNKSCLMKINIQCFDFGIFFLLSVYIYLVFVSAILRQNTFIMMLHYIEANLFIYKNIKFC